MNTTKALWAGRLSVIQIIVEYNPAPPFNSGHSSNIADAVSQKREAIQKDRKARL